MSAPLPEHRPAAFFALRTPLLPFETLSNWTATGANTGDERGALRTHLAALVLRPDFTGALAVASPDLLDSRAVWLARPESERGQRVERALVRYLLRACGRATPFGLFAGTSTGTPGTTTHLHLAPQHEYRRRTRLDLGYLERLIAQVAREPGRAEHLPLFPNPSAYRLAGRLRYVEVVQVESGRQHRLVAVDEDVALSRALALAAGGMPAGALAQRLALALAVPANDARAYVDTLVEAQVLTPDLGPVLTGEDPEQASVARLRAQPALADVAARLEQARDALRRLDAAGIAGDTAALDEAQAALAGLPVQPEPGRCVHVDLVKPLAAGSLGPEVLAEATRAAAVLARLRVRDTAAPLREFTERFLEHYPEGEAALVEVLDDEHGLGFGNSAGEPSVLLGGLEFGQATSAGSTPAGQAELVELLTEALLTGQRSVTLSDAQLERLLVPEPARLPETFALTFELAAASPQALAAGAFELCVVGLSGPSGARLLGRFCHADPALHQAVQAHLRTEEALQPGAVFAELVHLPEGRMGNVLARPLLRQYEIPYLGTSGADAEHLLPVDDLFIALTARGLRLRSRRLGREVVPRLSSAHNYGAHGLGLYRFLACLQDQHAGFATGFSWGALEAAAFLPRLTHGRLVLARARWRLSSTRLKHWSTLRGAGRLAALREARQELGLPRFVELTEGDHVLVFDLDNELALETLAELLRGRQEALLFEMFPEPDRLAVSSPEGRYVAEFVLPFERVVSGAPPIPAPRAPIMACRFLPGDEWLEARVFGGSSTLDGLLGEVLAPLARAWRDAGLIERFFFVRFGSPSWHLRLRFRGQPARLQAELQAQLVAALRPHVQRGLVRRLAFETYEREVLRYGGEAALDDAEAWFAADSEATAALIVATAGAAAQDTRPYLLLAGFDALLDDFGQTLAERAALARRAADAWRDELGASRQKLRLDALFRRARPQLLETLGQASPGARALGLGTQAEGARTPVLMLAAEALRARTLDSHAAVQRLCERSAAGLLTVDLPQLLGDLAHMHANRLLRGAAREHEYVAWDSLARLYTSVAARARVHGGSSASAAN